MSEAVQPGAFAGWPRWREVGDAPSSVQLEPASTRGAPISEAGEALIGRRCRDPISIVSPEASVRIWTTSWTRSSCCMPS